MISNSSVKPRRTSYSMVGFEVIDLLSKDQSPYVLAHKFNDIQRVRQPWTISTESVMECLSAPSSIQRASLEAIARSRGRAHLSARPWPTLYPSISSR
jgi:hypothetical protein